MRVAVTGTPGTGKTTATDRLESRRDDGGDGRDSDDLADLEVIHLNRAIDEEGLYADVDEARGSVVADLSAIDEWLGENATGELAIVESHLSHRFDADRVAVLRCHPVDLETRLLDRGETEAKARENAESEALDVILSEAVDRHGLDSVYEIDTTDRSPEEVADELEAVIRGERDPSAGEIDFVGYLA